MTDRELLELSSRAAGELTPSWYGNSAYMDGVLSRWNPLTDDGDALRLAVKLRMTVDVDLWRDTVQVRAYSEPSMYHIDESGEINSATRRAIVRAAAEIGKGME